MNDYEIEISESLSRIVTCKAHSREEAMALIQQQYRNSEIVLDADDFTSVEFAPIESTESN